jgi:predicted nucleic acid-binding Zn ribbon protein
VNQQTSSYECKNCGKALSWNGLTCSKECSEQLWTDNLNKRYAPTTLSTGVNERYGHETLRGAVKRRDGISSNYKFGRNCSHCGKHHNRYSQYCSNACKQTAYRRRHDPESGSGQRRRERAQNAVMTKKFRSKKIICEFCGEETFVSIAESTNRQYCSNACKQKAYRARRKP